MMDLKQCFLIKITLSTVYSLLERVSNNRLFSVLIQIEIRNLGENGLFERLNGDRDNRESRFHGTTTISSVVTLGSEERRGGEAKEPDQK